MRNDTPIDPHSGGRSSLESPLRLTGPEREQTSRRLVEKGWTPQRALNLFVDLMYGSAGHAERYCIYPPTPRARSKALDTYLLSDRTREAAVFVVSTDGPPTPRQAAEILREHGVPSLEMTSEQARRGQPQVVLPAEGES